MIEPILAPVRPRGCPMGGAVAVLLEEEIRPLVHAGEVGAIEILGGPGEGKTTTLQHLRATLGEPWDVHFVDEPSQSASIEQAMIEHAVIYTAQAPLSIRKRLSFRLSNWTLDDAIECLLSAHNDCCESVVRRLQQAPDRTLLGGVPALWRIVVEQMAASEQIVTVEQAILRHLIEVMPRVEDRRAAELYSYGFLATEWDAIQAAAKLSSRLREPPLWLMLRLRSVMQVLAAQYIIQRVRASDLASVLRRPLSWELIAQAARVLNEEEELAEPLLRSLDGMPQEFHPMTASLLHAAGRSWRPASGASPKIEGAFQQHVDWSGTVLAHPKLSHVNFSDANLVDIHWDSANCIRAKFDSASLRNARLPQFKGQYASFVDADLTLLKAPGGLFHNSDLTGAILTQAELAGAEFIKANLTEARFTAADLREASFLRATLTDADFTGANLASAKLSRLNLNTADFAGANLSNADLHECDLEGVVLPNAEFESANLDGALLSGSRISNGNFRTARLRNTGLADIDWENADLRGADMTNATFHMGSSRSGLVGSPIASEGSRTGFYTDEYTEQDFKAPEEIRKANLRGADLRGACIHNVDFYLVDLRDAEYSTSQYEIFRKCGAILESRA